MRTTAFLLAIGLVATTALPATATEPVAGTAVVPPHLGPDLAVVQSAYVTPSGLAAVAQSDDGTSIGMYWRTPAMNDFARVPSQTVGLNVGVYGSVVAWREGDSVRTFDGFGNTSTIAFTGTEVAVVPSIPTRVLAMTPGETAGTYVFRAHFAAQDPVVVTTLTCAEAPWQWAADGTGLAVVCRSAADDTKDEVHLVDLAGGSDHVLATVDHVNNAYVHLSGSTVAWRYIAPQTFAPSVATVPRDGSAAVAFRPAPGLDSLALLGDAVAWSSSSGQPLTMHTAPVDATQPESSSFPLAGTYDDVVWAGPGGFFVRMNPDAVPDTPGFSRFTAGATGLTYYADPPRAAALPWRVDLDSGYLLYADDSSGDTYVRGIGTGTVGDEYVAGTSDWWPGGVAVSGERVARLLDTGGAAPVIDVLDSDYSHRVFPATTGLYDIHLSGRRLLVSNVTSSVVLDTRTGTTLTLPFGAALWGRYVAYVDGAHQIVRRDLDAPLSATNPLVLRPAAPVWCQDCVATPETTLLSIYGDEVFWYTYAAGAEDAAVSRVSGTTVTRGRFAITSADTFDWATLGPAGLLVATDSGAADVVHVYDTDTLFSGPVAGTMVGTSDFDGPVGAVDVKHVAWAGWDRAFRVVTSPYATDRPAWLLGSLTPPAFSPNGDGSGDVWRAEFDADQPLKSWTFTVRDANGAVVASLPYGGSYVLGAMRPSWDGHVNGTPALAPDGTYTWTLTGVTAAGLPLRPSDGTDGPITGTVTIRTTKPSAVVHAPVLSTDVSATPSFALSWGSAAPGVTSYDVSWQEFVQTSPGTWVLGPVHAWQSATTAKSATFPGAQGHTYRFLVRARDDAGNVGPWAHATTVTPYDERVSLVTYAGSWSSLAASWRYLSTLKASSSRGAKATFTGYFSAVRLLGDRCTGCGQFTVYVDGHLIGTYDSYATTTKARQTLWSRSLGGVAKHTVTVVVYGTAGRAKVVLDGFAATR